MPSPAPIRLTLVGGPTLLIEIAGFRLLTDPTFDMPGDYASGTITLHKLTGPAIPVEEIGAIDAVLLSHDQHADNLDRTGRAFLPKAGTTFTTHIGAERLGLGEGLAPWDTRELKGPDGARLFVTAVPARHGPPGIEPIAGEVIGFALGVDAPGDALYISGDTVWYEGVAEIAKRFSPRIAVLFTGAAKPRGAFHLTMDANDALEAAHAFSGARIVAVHNEGWGHFSEAEDELAHAFTALGLGERLARAQRGEALSL
ncbi:MAG TPA: MBL fold metallo-hydrolase [Xanthobacteraceae bacterium]|jgi:L-ascorbate metabolism protein UlaG (beta-lactamase superfamily)|nr:MAG: MBL fold metallo-hydrolase [Rhizobiales bacterium 39-66-18]HQS09619.1 MBL fold metallo-hydrolase [Xanthobacteraceae bacterium]HQS49269.1 MBL fold metallo-hydrolase [Xanthobacteraceae bacterium]